MVAESKPRPTPDDRIRAALWFAERGFGVFSVWSTRADGVCRCPKGRQCDNAGKHPVTIHGFKEATTDPVRIRTFLSAGSHPNYGLVCPEGVFVLDVDGDGVARLVELEATHGPLPSTLRTRTGNGEHVFLRWPDDHPRPIGQLFGYVTRWGSGRDAGYVIGPRSVHATGRIYEPVGGTLDIATLPDAWAVAAVARPDREHDDEIVVGGGYQLPDHGYTGSRYKAILRYVASRYARGLEADEIFAGVVSVLAPRFAEPLSVDELRSRFDRTWKGITERLRVEHPDERPKPGPDNDRSVLLSSISTAPPPPMLIDRLDPLGHTILYGTGGVGKGALSCWWIANLVRDGRRVLILDYEGHPEEWSRRIAALAPDVHGSDALRHLAPTDPLARAVPEVLWTCDTYDLDYLVIDSAVMACGTDPLKPEAAAIYAAALVVLGRPALSLAHVTKVDDPRYPFGSVFWHNLARMTWSLTGVEDETLLKHRKHNNYPSLGTFAMSATWQDGYLREVWERGYSMTVIQRAVDVLEDGPLDLAEILARVNDGDHKPIDRDTLRRTLARNIPGRLRLADGQYSRVDLVDTRG